MASMSPVCAMLPSADTCQTAVWQSGAAHPKGEVVSVTRQPLVVVSMRPTSSPGVAGTFLDPSVMA